MKTYTKTINGTTWTICQEQGYWRAEDGEQVIASKTKRGVIKGINGDISEMMFHEWI